MNSVVAALYLVFLVGCPKLQYLTTCRGECGTKLIHSQLAKRISHSSIALLEILPQVRLLIIQFSRLSGWYYFGSGKIQNAELIIGLVDLFDGPFQLGISVVLL